MALSISDIVAASASRSDRWMVEDWTLLEWTGAMAGEVGEACNAAKKLKRLQGGMRSLDAAGPHRVAALEMQVAKEAADGILYGVLVFAKLELNLEDVLRQVFNEKSELYGFPERI